MKRFLWCFLFLTSIFLISACEEQELEKHSSEVPDAEEVLTLDPDADIFMWTNVVYKTNIDWVEPLKLTKDKELGEINSVSSKPDNYQYKNGMANKLPIGSKIYSVKERNDVLVVEVNGMVKKYLGASEG
ncbi:hypothetical protein M3196_13160 [Fictibacillus nanhaiensis]|uniref:hypothetical protein n=1 Tax=Fictibacillus nanhaiensis TaxID=742169 RepID=UPI00203D122B|nr:hypothetical protein [Fictibacillus nanhaiensis]